MDGPFLRPLAEIRGGDGRGARSRRVDSLESLPHATKAPDPPARRSSATGSLDENRGRGERHEKQYRGLWDAGFDALVVHNHGKSSIRTTRLDLFGYERSELTASTSPSLAEESGAFAVTAQFGNFQSAEAVGIRKDGTRIHLHLFNKPVPWSEDEVTIMAVRDLTEQKQREAVVQREKDRVELVLRQEAALTRIELASAQSRDSDDLCRQAVEAAASLLRVSIGSCLILGERRQRICSSNFDNS